MLRNALIEADGVLYTKDDIEPKVFQFIKHDLGINTSMEQFAELAVELEKTGVSHEMITYGGAKHAFTVFDSDRYNKDADKKSWKRFINFLMNTFK